MKKTILLIYVMAMSLFTFAQSSNLIIFSENGERFSVVLNGILQNAQPETNVMITDLLANSYKVKILFENSEVPDLDKTVYFQEMNSQATYRLVQNKKGEYVLRFFNAVPIAQAPPRPMDQPIVVYTTTPAVMTSTVTHSTTTSIGGHPAGDNVDVNVNMGGVNMNVSVNASDAGNATYTETYTETHTTTTTTGGVQAASNTYVLPGYSGPYGCPFPMSPADFESAKRSIAAKSFSDSKMALAKQILDSNCLLSDQVRQMMQLFDFEDDKLELAKYAYGYTLDYGNFYKLNDAFTFESSIEELDNYIRSFRR